MKLTVVLGKATQEGKHMVNIRVYHKKRTLYLATGYHVLKSEYCATQRKVHKGNCHKEINNFCEVIKGRSHDFDLQKKLQREEYTARELVNHLKPKKKKVGGNNIEENDNCFLFFVSQYIEELTIKKKFGQLKIAKSRLKKLQEFSKKSRIFFDELSIDFWTKYVQWCQDKKENKDVTIIGNLKFFSARFKEAFALGLHSTPSPFRLVIKRCNLNAEGVIIIPLTKDELKRIEAAKVSGFAAKAKKIFLFSCYSGISFSDIVLMKWENLQLPYVLFRRKKSHKHKQKYLIQKAQNLITERSHLRRQSPYVFGLIPPKMKKAEQYKKIESLNTQTNTALQIICKEAEIFRKITFHDGRRAFANLLDESGADIRAIQHALGHSKISTTEIYLAATRKSRVSDAIEAAFI